MGIYHTLGQPEICMFGLSSTDTMGSIINGIGRLMRAGQTFADGQESDGILEDYPCMFRSVDPSFYPEYFGYARWFHEGDDFPMLQCVWPDKNRHYPWESEFDARLHAQPLFAGREAWPFAEGKNTAVFTTRQVIEEGYPVLLVSHDEEGDWQFLCATTNDSNDGRVVSLVTIVRHHPSVAELADLPLGWQADRDSPEDPWVRTETEMD